VISTIRLPDDTVVEGLSPMWTDLDGDGTNEILVTLSNASEGARLAVFNDQGAGTAGQAWLEMEVPDSSGAFRA